MQAQHKSDWSGSTGGPDSSYSDPVGHGSAHPVHHGRLARTTVSRYTWVRSKRHIRVCINIFEMSHSRYDHLFNTHNYFYPCITLSHVILKQYSSITSI